MLNSKFFVGYEIDEVHFHFDASNVRNYLSSVQDRSSIHQETDLVPLTAVAALGLKTLLAGLSLPSGTLHAAQEISAYRSVRLNERLSCSARVAQSSVRDGGMFLVLEFALRDQERELVLDGRTTLVVPS